jgi:hypothetical protein
MAIVEMKRMAFLENRGSNPAQFKNARLEDLFYDAALDVKPIATPANRDKLTLQNFVTPSRCPVPSKCH